MALNPERNLYTNGAVFRLDLAGGQYDPAVKTHGASMMIGYRSEVAPGWVTAYVGGAYESHIDALPGARVAGTRGGVKTALEFNGRRFENFELYALATYSTAFDTYFAFVRPGFWVTDLIRIGPEAHLFGNTVYRDFKAGGFVEMKLPYGYRFTVSSGFLHPLTETFQDGVTKSRDGYYVNATFNFWR